MSRLTSLSAAAIKAMFSTESDATLMTLITIYDPTDSNGTAVAARLCDNYLQRLDTDTIIGLIGYPADSQTVVTDGNDLVYGVISRSNNYIYVPVEISLPSEEDNSAPKCSLVIHDVTRYLTPVIRDIQSPPKVLIELVLTSTPNVVEASFSGFYISNITYNADTVTCELAMTDYAVEPFPCFTFTPQYFPGIF
jgi:hypothetical protein